MALYPKTPGSFGGAKFGATPFGGGFKYPPLEEEYPQDALEIAQEEAAQYQSAIAFPLRFDDTGDMLLTKDEASVNDDLKMSVYLRARGLALFPFGAGVEDLCFDPMDAPTEVFAADKIGIAVHKGNEHLRVLEEDMRFVEHEDNKLSVAVPYINTKTGRGASALLSIPRQRTDT